ncbi:MAG: oligoendopeptidase F [Firmicutes bacterium]|nr:oligoendopeptidase F [Bacillota bacterium]
MKRSEVKPQFLWDLRDIFVSAAEWEKELSALNRETVGILRYKGRLAGKGALLECLKFSDVIGKRIEKAYAYAMFLHDENIADTVAAELKSKIETLCVRFNADASFVTPELSALPAETLEGFIADPAFSDYDYQLRTVLKEKKHILSDETERVLALAGKTTHAFSDIFSQIDNVDLPFPSIEVGGKKVRLTHGTYGLLLQNPDREIRKKAFFGIYKAVGALINTTGANFAASVNKDNFLAQARKYGSALEKSLSGNDVPTGVYETLVAETGKRIKTLHDYMGLRKNILGLESLHMYDLHVPMYEKAELSLSFEDAFETVLAGLAPMGEEYLSLLRSAKQNRWIDVEETENKRSGAYSCGVYGVHPYVLLNYKPTTHDVFTIAHELGHALHSYYSAQNQPYAKNDYSIFVAEVASTVNEVLLLKHLLKIVSNQKTKKFLLSYYLDMFRTTLFRQTMFAEFESEVHGAEAAGVPLTVEWLSKRYLALNKKYYGSGVSHDRQIRLEWARIPHFYRAFYVYQYATGLTAAVNIANHILSGNPGAVASYKAFLSAGGHKSPYEILKDAGVDLATPEPYGIAFGEFADSLRELMINDE